MTINKSGEINFNKLVTHQLSKEKAERVTTNAVFDVTTSLVRFNPLHRFRKLWDITLSFLLAYNLVVTPFTIGFGMSEGTGSAIFWLNRVVDIFFMADIALNFETGIYAGEKIIMDKCTVQRMYLRGWFAVDFVSSIPLDPNELRSTDGPLIYDSLTVVQFMELFRLLKLFKTIKIYENFEKALVFRYEDMGIVRFLLFIMACLHWSACTFSWLDETVCVQSGEYSSFVDSGLDDENRKAKYIAALYWALATMTTIGFGDISAQCSATRTFSLVVMLVSSVVYAYGLSYVMEVMRNKRKAEREFRDLMDLVNKYMVFRNIPKDLREEIRKFFNYISESDAKKNDLLSERVILEELSPELRVAVLCHVNSGLLEKVPLFLQIQECIGQSRSILQEMVFHMRSQVFRPLESVLKEGNEGNELFFVTSGTCVQIKWNSITVNVITEGEYYGEAGFLHNSQKPAKSQIFDMTELHKEMAATSQSNVLAALGNSRGFSSQGDLLSQGLASASKGSFGRIELDKNTPEKRTTTTPEHVAIGKRNTFSGLNAPSHVEHVRAQQRGSASSIGSANNMFAEKMETGRLMDLAKPYAQRYSLVTQSYADLRYITRELFDEIAKTLPKVKYLKVYRLMHTRYQEVCQEQEAREVELERLYPEIKEEYMSLEGHDVEDEEDDVDWRNQEMDFVEEEVNEAALDLHEQNKAASAAAASKRRPSVANAGHLPAGHHHHSRRTSSTPRRNRRPSINKLMSPRKKVQHFPSFGSSQPSPAGGSPPPASDPAAGGRRRSQPQHFDFMPDTAPIPPALPKQQKLQLMKSYSLVDNQSSTRNTNHKALNRLSSGVLGSQNNSISNVIKQEQFTTPTPNIFQNSVPTIAVVHSNLGRFFDRALSMAGPAVDDLDKSGDVNGAGDESSDGGSSVHSLQSFGDLVFDESGTDLSDRLDSSPKRVLSNQLSTPDVTKTLTDIETIEASLTHLCSHVSQLKRELSMQRGLVPVTEGDESDTEDGHNDSSGSDCSDVVAGVSTDFEISEDSMVPERPSSVLSVSLPPVSRVPHGSSSLSPSRSPSYREKHMTIDTDNL